MAIEFVHPLSKEPLVHDDLGRLRCQSNPTRTTLLVRPTAGSYDFASLHKSSGDRAYYNSHYQHDAAASPQNEISAALLERLWEQNSSYKMLHKTVGDVRGKSMLLLGNGTSLKELRFVSDGADVVYTDISLEAVLSVKMQHAASSVMYPANGVGTVEFHAVDALHLPFPDESFNIIYGCAFAHHLDDLSAFFIEVHRCLKPGGKCVFLDDAYSPAWQFVKSTILRPLQAFSHWRTGISPEDRRASLRGGYRKEELQFLQTRFGFNKLVYQRAMYLEHLLRRGSTKLLSVRLAQPLTSIGQFIDLRVLGPHWIEANGLHLVWGYTK